MRATLSQAMVVVVMISVSGCTTSSPTWSSLAFWRKKPDTAAVAGGEAPKYNAAAAATLPSANQNPNSSLAGIAKPPASVAAGVNPAVATTNPAGAAGLSGYGATPAGYQSATYPTTPYPQAKLTAAGAAGAMVTPGTPATAAAASSSYTAASPAYGAAPATPAVGQPQAGLYNPTYDGGAASRYVSGAAIPPTQSSMPDYRTADARNAMSASVAPTTMAAAPLAASAPMNSAPPTDDRYSAAANSMPSAAAMPVTASAPAATAPATAAAPSSNGPFPATPDRYSLPASPAAGSYDPSATGYQPAQSANPVGNTGYNPPNVYSPSASAGSIPMPGLPAQSNTEYRPGGTSNFVSPTGAPVQPASAPSAVPGAALQNGGVTPAAYLPAAVNSNPAPSGVVLASATSPISSGSEVYGAYQGSSGGSTSEPAYSPPTPTATSTHTGW